MIGRDTGPAGRVFRLLIGLTGFGLLAHRLISTHASGTYVAETVMFGLLLCAGYTVVWRLLDGRFIGRVHPLITSGLLLVPIVAYTTHRGGSPFYNSIALYMSSSLLVNAASGYGGVETAAVPVLVWRSRRPTYSPFTTVDLLERAYRERWRGGSGAPLWIASMVVTAFVFLMFWVVPVLVYVPPFGSLPVKLPGALALVLVGPAALFAYEAVVRRDRAQTLAAVTAALLAPAFAVMSSSGAGLQGVLWGVIVFAGVAYGVVELVRLALRRHRRDVPEAAEVAGATDVSGTGAP